MKINKKKIDRFQQKILDRYLDHKRSLPRRDTFDPYRVLVSEVMSQQTQVERVVPKFEKFVSTLPRLSDLAIVDKTTLLSLRSGLWFNSRALRLQQTAHIINTDYDGIVPNNREILITLPGIWPYTSASICAFAYNMPEPVVDTNIRRVLIHELWLDITISPSDLEDVARMCIPVDRSNDRHNALMDYGSLVATASATGIKPTSKQSKFKWSDREVKWWTLKQLVDWNKLSEGIIAKKFPDKAIKSILMDMQKDGLIQINKKHISIAI